MNLDIPSMSWFNQNIYRKSINWNPQALCVEFCRHVPSRSLKILKTILTAPDLQEVLPTDLAVEPGGPGGIREVR